MFDICLMPKRIFLDSRDWIQLARISKGKEPDPILINVYKKIKEFSDSGEIIFPFSMFHLEDMIKNTNKKQRDDIIDTMVEISKGCVMKPFLLFREKEIENAILRLLDLNPIHDIKSQIIGRGIAYIAGEEYHVSSSNPDLQKFLDEKEQELRNIADSVETMVKFLKDEHFSLFFRKGSQMYLQGAIEMEKNRTQRKTWKKTERYKYEINSYISKFVFPHFKKFTQNNRSLQNGVMTFIKSPKDFELLLEYMPSSYIFVQLTFARDEGTSEREIPPNDLIDVAHLAGAVPYCDVVVIEKMFAGLCYKLKLDKKYGCTILNSLKDLNELLC